MEQPKRRFIVEFVGGPRDAQRDDLTEKPGVDRYPLTIASATGVYEKGHVVDGVA